jgi:RHS repeat-associated protein
MDEVFSRADSGGPRSFVTDGLGSTLALTDSTGTVQTQYTYEPFGRTTSSGIGSSNSYQYTGRENDGTGLYYYRARYYSPTLQRFVSEDPIGFDGGINFYEYADSNPVAFIDSSGLSSLVFDRGSGTLDVYDGKGNYIGRYDAGNFTTNPGGDPKIVGSNGPAPNGTYPVQAPINTGVSPAYGPYFFPIGAPGSLIRRRGIGLHGGRRGPMSRTNGCIRVSNDTDRKLYQLYQTDPIQQITIQ